MEYLSELASRWLQIFLDAVGIWAAVYGGAEGLLILLWFLSGNERWAFMEARWLRIRVSIVASLALVAVMIGVHNTMSELETQVEHQTHELEKQSQMLAETERRATEADGRLEEALANRGRQNEQLNIIVFDATSLATYASFGNAVNQFKRVLGDCSIDDRWFWENRSPYQRTTLYYQEERARDAAMEVGKILPGSQDVFPLSEITLFGIHPDRDIVMFLGNDANFIARRLAADSSTYDCPRLD